MALVSSYWVECPEYLQYLNPGDALAATSAASLIVTDLPHIETWATKKGIDLFRIGDEVEIKKGNGGTAPASMLSEIQRAFDAIHGSGLTGPAPTGQA